MQLDKPYLWRESFLDSLNSCQWFEQQVEQTPDAIAVVFEGQKLTYHQLNQRANQLGNYLHSLGISAEKLVGIYAEKSIEMVVGILSILKSGGAYVPLEPSYPAERTAFILQDTQVPIILTQQQFKQNLPPHSAHIICLDSDWETIARYSPENLSWANSLSDLMYVIYTSGSTGKPKGVMVTHANICNQLHWRQTTFPLSLGDRVLQNISFSFDPSVWQIFWTLTCGAQLILPKPGGNQDCAYLVQLIIQHQITVIALVPSLLRVFLEASNLDQCTSLKHVFCGGEPLPLDLQQRFFERLSGTLLHNVYGPTEASIDATFWTCTAENSFPIAPIGCPILNAEAYVLDAELQPKSANKPGELYIGGQGLARGYLNRPELTAEKFIPNPYSQEPGARLYKTGDLARYLPDGKLEFVGRVDYQVKIRGFRVELGEIEASLRQHFSVQQCVVIAHDYALGDRRLVAYVVLFQGQIVTTNQLRSFLRDRLPGYMVPSIFVYLEALPLNANGKVDRKTLPVPDSGRPVLEQVFVAPQDSLEIELTEIWQQVLNIQPIGVHDDFFELGGNSLLAVRLFTQIEERFHKRLPLTLLFQGATIHSLSNHLKHNNSSNFWNSLVTIQPNGSKPPFFCVHGIGGEVLSFYQLAHYLGRDQPFYALQAQVDDPQTPSDQIEAIAANYLQAIQTIQTHGPYFLGGFSFGGLVAYEMAQQLNRQGEEVAILALIDSYRFKLLPAPLRMLRHLRKLIQLKPQEKWDYFQRRVANQIQPVVMSRIEHNARSLVAMNEQAANQYQIQAYSGYAVLFKAREQPKDWLDLLDLLESTDPHASWKYAFRQGLEIREISGNHFTLLEDPYVKELAEALKICLGGRG